MSTDVKYCRYRTPSGYCSDCGGYCEPVAPESCRIAKWLDKEQKTISGA